MAKGYTYELLQEDGKVKYCPMNDPNGEITGRSVWGVEAWFDENPEERKRLGWIKHIRTDIRKIEYNHQTQYLSKSIVQIDDYTIEDVYHIMDKSEEMMRLEELLNMSIATGGGGIVFFGEEDEFE